MTVGTPSETVSGTLPESCTSDAEFALPYSPSWADRLTAAIDAAPGPAAAYYGAAASALLGFGVALKWWDGTFPVGTVTPFFVLAVCTPVYYLALVHYLDIFAERTLHEFRPTLAVDDREVEALRYRITTMPARDTLLVTLAGFGASAVSIWGIANGHFLSELGLFTSPVAAVFESFVVMATYPILFVFLFHAKHQLRTISLILARCTTINLYQQGPLYVFPRLTARTSISLILIGYLWVAMQPSAATDVSTLFISAMIAGTGLAAFVWPLWGVHRVLVQQKTRALDGASQRLQRSLGELHRRIDEARFDHVDPPIRAVSALRQELEMLEKIPTWPWRPETIRGVLSAVGLPLILWILTRLLDQFLTW